MHNPTASWMLELSSHFENSPQRFKTLKCNVHSSSQRCIKTKLSLNKAFGLWNCFQNE